MYDFNVSDSDIIPAPEEFQRRLPADARIAKVVGQARHALCDILDRRDPRLFIVVGPCSIHDPVAGLDYARRLRILQDEVADVLLLVMRVYFEKPRTTTGWKGLINDPDLDGTYRIAKGMERARRFLLDVCDLGLAAATEALDPVSPHYLGDLVAWTAIGARTTESQIHRELASGLPTPVAFKNGTDGDIGVAVNAILAAARPHARIGINADGRVSVLNSKGNRHGHLVLRGGNDRPNYDAVSVGLAEQALARAGLPANIVVDCAHGNSYKNPALQPMVMRGITSQIRDGNQSLVGAMIESNLEAGNQAIPDDLSKLKYGCSITDACADWDATEDMILGAADELRAVRSLLLARCGMTPAAKQYIPAARGSIGLLARD
ncbi:MAG TPA: 3-deoxy-7-phosphoheptulonate synthase [Paucimonas sp.]|nr:3-deoxy-7-phosphoheptulonate synthase [Paucimonas sp.]